MLRQTNVVAVTKRTEWAKTSSFYYSCACPSWVNGIFPEIWGTILGPMCLIWLVPSTISLRSLSCKMQNTPAKCWAPSTSTESSTLVTVFPIIRMNTPRKCLYCVMANVYLLLVLTVFNKDSDWLCITHMLRNSSEAILTCFLIFVWEGRSYTSRKWKRREKACP